MDMGDYGAWGSSWCPAGDVDRRERNGGFVGGLPAKMEPARQGRSDTSLPPPCDGVQTWGNVNGNGAAQHPGANDRVKTPRISGDADFEAFLAQFKLLADSDG